MMKDIIFIDFLQTGQPSDTFIAKVLPEISSKDQLLNKLQQVLLLPDYFGLNWDALEECLLDFSWINSKKIMLVHGSFDFIYHEQFEIYLSILLDVIRYWENDKERIFEVIFPLNDKEYINKLMKNLKK